MKRTKQPNNQGKKIRPTILNSLSEGVGVTDNDRTFLFTNPLTNKIPGIRPIDIILTDQENFTESKLKEIELIKSEEQLKAVFKGFPIPSYLWQYVVDDFILIDHNDAAEFFTKGLIKKFLGESFSTIYKNSSYKQNIESDFLKCFSEKKNIIREMPYQLRSSEKIKELKVHYGFVPPDLILVHTEDITDHKLAGEELRMLSNAVEQTADSVVITNKKGIIEYVNPAFVETTGYSLDETLGQTPRILNSGKHDKTFYKKLWETILSGNTFRETIINKKKNDELYWSQQTITPMKNNDGKITHFVSVLKDITELLEKKEQEIRLKIASELQQRLYKSKISVPGFNIAGKTYSAVETCGDYFDFIQMKDGSIGIVIGDVSGHGIGAALIMVQTLASLRAIAKFETDLGAIITHLNQALVDNLDDTHYVTLILARLDPKKSSLQYVSAGHIPAYLLKGSDDKVEMLESTDIPLGIVKDHTYHKSNTIKLSPRDILAFITDGIIETRLHNEDEFGYHRTINVIKSYRQATASQITEEIYQATRSFVKHRVQEDDITSIICKVGF
jgi:sigma-B regulation protein RsbU (phosphoserine phosphatase)